MSSHLDYEINKELGECYLFMGELDKAETYYEKAIQANPEFSAPFVGLATIAIQNGDLDKALELYKKGVEAEYNEKALAGIGLVLMEKGLVQEAFEKFAEALNHCADNVVALSCIVRIAYAENKIIEVVPFLQRAIEVSDENFNNSITLAGCFVSLDRNPEAIAILEAIMEKAPECFEAKELLDHIRP